MPRELWWLWMIAAAAFTIGEIFTAGFFLLWFGIGAAAAGILTLLGFGAGWQLFVFVVLSLLLFAASRRFAEKWTKTQPSGVGADRLMGKRGVVLEEIDNLRGTGSVKVEREQWRADSMSGEVIPKDTLVEVIKIDGTHLLVMIAKEEE
ncbi:MAG TPA: NfeD family protein [Armatimonadota bacterium]|nr:NfeD family protein [Armatimonadota bacterium]